MKPIANDIVLRPRFQLELSDPKDKILENFEKSEKVSLLVNRLDEHIFIKFDKKNNHFWSPQLHLEIVEIDQNNSKLYGVFGPNPNLWTFFMFLHFAVAAIFIVLCIWAYSSAALEKPYGLQLGLMGFMAIIWFVLYFFGRAGKHKGKPQMEELHLFMIEVLT